MANTKSFIHLRKHLYLIKLIFWECEQFTIHMCHWGWQRGLGLVTQVIEIQIQPIFKAKKYTETDNKILVLAPDVKRVFMFIGDIVGLHIGCISWSEEILYQVYFLLFYCADTSKVWLCPNTEKVYKNE